jgi:hypothetical protein
MSQLTGDVGPPDDEGQAPPQDPADIETLVTNTTNATSLGQFPPVGHHVSAGVVSVTTAKHRHGVTRGLTSAVTHRPSEAELIAGRLANASQWCPIGASIAFADCQRNVIAVTITDKDGTKREYMAEVRPIRVDLNEVDAATKPPFGSAA